MQKTVISDIQTGKDAKNNNSKLLGLLTAVSPDYTKSLKSINLSFNLAGARIVKTVVVFLIKTGL